MQHLHLAEQFKKPLQSCGVPALQFFAPTPVSQISLQSLFVYRCRWNVPVVKPPTEVAYAINLHLT
jgi:hypothetical protein